MRSCSRWKITSARDMTSASTSQPGSWFGVRFAGEQHSQSCNLTDGHSASGFGKVYVYSSDLRRKRQDWTDKSIVEKTTPRSSVSKWVYTVSYESRRPHSLPASFL